jgi:hypothetical protein
MKLTGYESSVLALLAQRPELLILFKKKISGFALDVASYIAGELQTSTQEVKETGDAYLSWAEELHSR